jgi:transcriptional regulator with XRE-family HTH domain
MDVSRVEAGKALADAVRPLREQTGLSQEAFAAQIGIHRNHQGQLERGETNPTWFTLLRVSEGLGVSVAELTARAEANLREELT